MIHHHFIALICFIFNFRVLIKFLSSTAELCHFHYTFCCQKRPNLCGRDRLTFPTPKRARGARLPSATRLSDRLRSEKHLFHSQHDSGVFLLSECSLHEDHIFFMWQKSSSKGFSSLFSELTLHVYCIRSRERTKIFSQWQTCLPSACERIFFGNRKKHERTSGDSVRWARKCRRSCDCVFSTNFYDLRQSLQWVQLRHCAKREK